MVWVFEDKEKALKSFILQEDWHLEEFPETALSELRATVSIRSSHYVLHGYEAELLKNEL